MKSFITKGTRVRFILGLILLVLLTYFFWSSSRYPSLGDKALMGGAIQLEDPLSFEAHWPVSPEFPLWKKIFFSTGNWIHTNRQGMFFGILMGAIFLALMQYLQRVSFKNAFLNSVAGMILGTPLGVCVNCAAPIAKGLYSGGARAETMLSTMIASPSLNLVVLTMMFSILPFYMAATKLALSIVIILVAVPFICHFLPDDQQQLPISEQTVCAIPDFAENEQGESFVAALKGFTHDFGKSLWYIVRLTLPLMILAGFLGAVIANLVPLEMLNSVKVGIIGLIIIALIGTFLPVPIAFDVVICGALLAGGLAVGSVMTLLFTLGIFSIYSFFIVWQSISLRTAATLGIVIVLIGVGAGVGVEKWHKGKTKKALDLLTSEYTGTAQTHRAPISNTVQAGPLKTSVLTGLSNDDIRIKIERIPFNERSEAAEASVYKKRGIASGN